MSDRRPTLIAQPGMTAAGRAAERELEAYGRSTSLHAPDDLADRVMAAIAADAPTRRVRVAPWTPSGIFSRLRMAGSLLAVILALTVGAALAVAGASALIQRDAAPPTVDRPDDQPIIVVEPTPTPASDEVDEATPAPPDALEPPEPPKPPDHQAVEATHPSDRAEGNEPEATEDADRKHESEATDEDEPDATQDADDTDEPDQDSSRGSSGGDSSDSGDGGG